MAFSEPEINFRILTEFRYLMYQSPTLSHFLIGLPIRNGTTFVHPTVPLLGLNLQTPAHYSGAEPFFCVNLFNADWNVEDGAVNLLPPNQMTHADALYLVPSSALVWNHSVVSCPGVLNLVPYSGPTPAAERSVTVRWLPSTSFVTKQTLQTGFESLGHVVLSIVFKTAGLAVIEFLNPYSVPIILLGQRELSLVFDNTTTIWVSKLHDEVRNRVYVTFQKLDATADKFTSETLQGFFASLGFALQVSMEKVSEPRCAILEFNSEVEANSFLAGQRCRSFYIGNRQIKAKPFVPRTPKN